MNEVDIGSDVASSGDDILQSALRQLLALPKDQLLLVQSLT